MALVQAKESFATFPLGSRRVAKGEVFDDSDPIVAGREDLFEPIKVSSTDPAVEQATAAPGEKRASRRSK